MSTSAILFDLDLTLTDRAASIRRYAAALRNDFVESLDGVSVEAIASTIVSLDDKGDRPREELAAGLVATLPWRAAPASATLEEHWRRRFPQSTVGRPKLHETLTRLRRAGIRLGVVTNGSVAGQGAKIDYLRLRECVDVVVVSEAVGHKKPAPEIFRHALDALGTSPQDTLFVGDHPIKDIAGARSVGMTSIWFAAAKHPWPRDVDPPAHAIWNLPEIFDVLLERALASHEAARGG